MEEEVVAIIPALPAQDIIDGLRGTIDFYCHDGLICVRKWPRSPGKHRSTDVQAQWPAFRYINKQASYLSPSLIASYQEMASGSRLTWKDLLVRAYLKGIPYI